MLVNFKAIALSVSLLVSNFAFANEDHLKVFEKRKPAQMITQGQKAQTSVATSSWTFLLPTFVIHGITPGTDVGEDMPRKLDSKGQSVITPGFGFEYKSGKSFDALAAFVKDCYDHYAGTFQVGQTFKMFKESEIGYTVGLYIRETPVSCYTETTTVTTGGHNHTPPKKNSFTSTKCAFQDNLPLRYTLKSGNGFIDVIPSPFVNFSTKIYHGDFDVNLKVMSNFYLNEFGLSIPF